MKKIFLYTMVAGMMLGSATSCESFLEEENLSNINSDEYFSESTGFESLVAASYASLRSIWQHEPWLFCLGVDIYTRGESELVSGSYGNRDVYSSELNEYATLDAENGYVSSFYTNVYYGIQVCNTAIAKSETVSGMNAATLAQRVAEVRFLRAYYYYLLVEQFGDVAIVTDEIRTAVTDFPRSTEQDVYSFIISELTDISNVLPVTQSNYGRITQGAVKHLLSLVYLTRGYKSYGQSTDFSTAASLADEVINGGAYKLLDTFAEVFTPGNEENKEIIFSVQYDPSSLGSQYGGNGQQSLFGFELWNKVTGGFENGNLTYGWKKNQFMCTQFLYSLFNTNDDSRYEDTFKSVFYATQAAENIGLKVGDMRLYFPTYDQPFTEADSLAIMNENPNAIIITKEFWKQDIENMGGRGMSPMVWKFFDPEASWPSNNTNYTGTRDIFLFRLADTYLMAAEAYFKAGNSATAAQRINAIRERAAKDGHKSAMSITASDVNIDFILDERGRELVGEYKRWMDLKRTGKLIERTLKYNKLTAKINKMDDHILLRPIPQSVIDQSNGTVTQNPGY